MPPDFLTVLAQALERVVEDLATERIRSARNAYFELPENAKSFPAAKVGDRLYAISNKLTDGVAEYVILHVTAAGYARIAQLDEPDPWDRITWAVDWHYSSLAELLRNEAQKEMAYHMPRLAYARKVLEAVNKGLDLTPFVEGQPIED